MYTSFSRKTTTDITFRLYQCHLNNCKICLKFIAVLDFLLSFLKSSTLLVHSRMQNLSFIHNSHKKKIYLTTYEDG